MSDAHRLQGRQAWPTMLFFREWADHAAVSPDLVNYLYERKEKATTNIASGVAVTAKSMQGLYESEFDLFEAKNPAIQKLVKWIDETLRQAVSVANGQEVPPNGIEVEFVEAWSHISNQGGFHDAHYHGNCSWCGIFYVRAGDSHATDASGAGNGISRFYSPFGTGGQVADYGSKYLSNNRIDITPQDGLLVLFPSYLLHSGLPYRGERDRILIAFNTKTWLKSD